MVHRWWGVSLAIAVLAFIGLFRTSLAQAQEFDCQVDLNLTALSEQDRVQWVSFKNDVQAYINNYEWTSNFSGERIRCTFQFNITSSNGSVFDGQLFVTSSRPLYKNDQLTTMARFLDNNVEFSYSRGQVLQHGNSFRQLESLLDYYANVILGLDYDSYQHEGGTQYFQAADEVAIVANSAAGKGWERTVTAIGTYSRLGYVEDAIDANQRVVRDLMFEYNYQALDLLGTKPEEARINLASVIDSFVILKKQTSVIQRSPFVREFFDAKYPELADLGRLFPDNLAAYFAKLSYLDPLHDTYYEGIKQKLGQ